MTDLQPCQHVSNSAIYQGICFWISLDKRDRCSITLHAIHPVEEYMTSKMNYTYPRRDVTTGSSRSLIMSMELPKNTSSGAIPPQIRGFYKLVHGAKPLRYELKLDSELRDFGSHWMNQQLLSGGYSSPIKSTTPSWEERTRVEKSFANKFCNNDQNRSKALMNFLKALPTRITTRLGKKCEVKNEASSSVG